MRKVLLCLIVMFLFTQTSMAQLSGAPFSSSQGTYIPITGGSVLGNTSTNDQVFVDPAVPLGVASNTSTGTYGPGFPIGFNFVFDGVVYDQFAVNANGWISLGQSALGSSAVCITSATGPLIQTSATITPPELVARVAGLACNLAGQTGSEIRIQTVGTAPNQECVIQWKGYRVSGQTGDNLNFQIRLVQTLNQVRIIYGQMTKNATAVNASVGMRDKPANFTYNYTNRILNPSWANTAPGTSPGNSCQLSNIKYPANGLTFIYDPVPPCTGIPNPGNTISTSTLLCPGANFTLSLQNFTPGYAVTYQWQYSLSGSDPWNNVTTPASPHFAQITLNETESTWYRCQVTCSGNTTASNPILVSINTWLYCGFCVPLYGYFPNPPYGPNAYDNVNLVTIYPLSQATGLNFANDYYLQYVYTQNAIPDIARGQSFNLNLTFNSDSAQYFGVWIDFDHSSAFDSDEFFSTGTNIGALGTISFPITVPTDALPGNTRMRIRGGDNVALSPNQACGYANSDFTGGAQDYLVNIVETSIVNGYVYDFEGNPVQGALIVCKDRGTTTTDADGFYSFAIPSGAMQLECSKTGYNSVTITSVIPPASTSTQDFTLTNPVMAVNPDSLFIALIPAATEDLSLDIINSGNGSLNWSAIVNYNTNRSALVTYCTARSTTCLFGNVHITQVILNTINNISTCNTYSDFTSVSTNLVPGETYTISITEGGNFAAGDMIWAWIDYDQDGKFNEEPIVLTGTPPNKSCAFTVPASVKPGPTRLRIRLSSDQDPLPCGVFNYGEVEDYTVNILSWLTLDNNIGSVNAGTTSTIPVHVNAGKAEDGNPGIIGQTYISELVLNSDPEVGTFTIPVKLAVMDPSLLAPEELTPYILDAGNGRFMLKWRYFSNRDDQLDHFVITRNDEIFGNSTVSSFEFVLNEPGEYCFKVYALYVGGSYSGPSNEVCITFPLAPGVPITGWAIGLGALLIIGYAFFMIRRKS